MSSNLNWTTRQLDYEPPEVDTSRAQSARVYDYLLGGKDNYPLDREAAEGIIRAMPGARVNVQQNRLFLGRAARWLAAGEGISQFLDIGSGIPTSPNLHEVTQQVNPAARVVYVDNDPIVAAHMNARMVSTPAGQVGYLRADLRDPAGILTAAEVTSTLDLSRPLALLFVCSLSQAAAADEVPALVHRYLAALAPGSFLVLSMADHFPDPEGDKQMVATAAAHGLRVAPWSHAQVLGLFDGLDLIEPGVVMVHQWRPDAADGPPEYPEVGLLCGVARVP
jgi:hypothetical protein